MPAGHAPTARSALVIVQQPRRPWRQLHDRRQRATAVRVDAAGANGTARPRRCASCWGAVEFGAVVFQHATTIALHVYMPVLWPSS